MEGAGSYKPPDSACPFHINPGAVQQVPYRVSFSRVVERPFTDHDFFVASEQLNNIGATTDLGRTVDFVMVSPTIDAQIEFDRDIKATTPVISGGTIFRWNLRVRTIHHKAVSTTLTGQLYVWVAWF